jgi:hypothetical protein
MRHGIGGIDAVGIVLQQGLEVLEGLTGIGGVLVVPIDAQKSWKKL